MRFGAVLFVALVLSGCAAGGLGDAVPGAPGATAIAGASVPSASKGHAPLVRPAGRLRRADAQRYALALVNRDRAAHDLPPVGWDETALRAAARHASDIASRGFTAHIGTDGSVPEQRYTAAGGTGLVMENVGCFADGIVRVVDPDATFDPASIEKVESSFMDEVPPNDGHRRNILAPRHASVGIALAATQGLPDFTCMSQEFVDDYGSFGPLPKRAKVGATVRVTGELRAPAKIAGVGISRADSPHSRKPEELNHTFGYAIPKPFISYFGRGFKTPRPVEIQGNRFSIDVPLSDDGKAGLYGVSVWASFDGARELQMVSLRVVEVD